jgi:hypothetical protein
MGHRGSSGAAESAGTDRRGVVDGTGGWVCSSTLLCAQQVCRLFWLGRPLEGPTSRWLAGHLAAR